jgi:hypothetical protein
MHTPDIIQTSQHGSYVLKTHNGILKQLYASQIHNIQNNYSGHNKVWEDEGLSQQFKGSGQASVTHCKRKHQGKKCF